MFESDEDDPSLERGREVLWWFRELMTVSNFLQEEEEEEEDDDVEEDEGELMTAASF